ncbi:MAG: phospholipase D family protein, partial [Acidimicrobiia bacterium]|nr:phospholipase D family protein [Acidimicrobiia bacterium]
MLEPESRHALLDNLRPPPGFVLDRAVGTTYSLDLMALLTAPLAFALFDRVRSDDSGLVIDPIALLEAVRRHADRIDIFCQAGQISPMREYRPIVTYLEQSIHAAVPRRETAIFHPKVWVLRFRDPESEERRYRLLCLSRNLTFDQSWDTALVMDGSTGRPQDGNGPLSDFLRSLPALAVGEIPQDRVAAVRDLAQELAEVHFELPPGFHDMRYWPLGHDAVERWPFEGRIDRLLVISPFLTIGMTHRLRSKRRWDSLISRPETLDHLGSAATEDYSEVLVLSPDANVVDAPAVDGADEAPDRDTAKSYLEGLHAKCFIADAGRDARVWTGSANATDAAYGGNVEFLVELIGRRARVGIEAVMADQPGQPTLRSILEPYRPPNGEPMALTADEEIERDLDAARRRLGALVWTADAGVVEPDVFSLRLRAVPRDRQSLPADHGPV